MWRNVFGDSGFCKSEPNICLKFRSKNVNLMGGFLMGLGAVFVPGGNDVILLNSIPTLSLQAVPSYILYASSMAIIIMLKRWHENR
jgi:hypothetical protein